MLADVIPKIAAEGQEDKQPYRPRPSLAGPERCIRQLVYYATGTPPKPLAGRALLIFDDSSWHEELTADWIRKSAFQLHSTQMEVETPIGKGRIDGIITDLMGVDVLWEHKAINHFTFERIGNGAWPLDYFTQCALYLVGLQKVNPDMDRVLLLLKNKNTAQYLELLLRYDRVDDTLTLLEIVRSDGQRIAGTFVMERVVAAAKEKFAQIEEHKAQRTLPPRPYEYGTEFPCGYCPYAGPCWAGYQQEFTALTTDAALDQELVDAAAYYCETRGHISDMEDEKDKAKETILRLMNAQGIRHGKTSQYALTLAMREKTSWDEAQIPADIVNRAKRRTPYVQLDVRKLKVKEATNNGN